MGAIFSNREIAVAIWAVGLLIWSLTSPSLRNGGAGVVRAFAQRPILIMFGLMTAYVVLMVLVLKDVGLWHMRQLKDTILWAIFVGGASMFRLTSIAEDSSYFLETIKDNLKLIVVLEFIVNVFVFSLPTELILVAVATFIALLLVFSERDERLKSVTGVLNNLMMVVGCWLLGHAIYEVAANFSAFANKEMLADFSLTPILTFCFFPFLFLAARFAHHQHFAITLGRAIRDSGLRRIAYRRALLRFKLNVACLNRWVASLYSRDISTTLDIDKSIDRILAMREAERSPPPVPFLKGWSPYAAKEFLKKEGFKTGYYTSYDDIEWYASTPSQDVEKSSLNTIEYALEGSRETATKLKLTLTVYEAAAPDHHLSRFAQLVASLYEAAMQAKLGNQVQDPHKLEQHWIVGNRRISLRTETWTHRLGYELTYLIEVIPELDIVSAL